ncbi:hypothetical protein LCGC14_0987650 [marine sediment metagenome]|uniref:Uncharacterized protein n=1 Tax=marine sediment metagenome TaxID=412755 RepID=A0A0F9RDF8_9ZZZZ
MKKISYINRLIKHKDFTTKILVYFSTKTYGDDYDPYEDNYTYTNLNPLSIKCYITEISPEALVWKQYGLKEIGAKEILCEAKYAEWFRIANKIEIDNDVYEVYKESVGNRVIIQKRPYNLIRVVLQKKN